MADILINILGDASKLKGELDKSSKNVTSFSEKIGKVGKIATAAGLAVTTAFTAIVLKTAAVGDQFDKMSLRTGVAVEDLSALAYAADISGSDIGTLEKGLKALTKVMDDASIGIGEGMEAFEFLGISVTDTEGKLRSTVDVLKEAATKIAAVEDPTKQLALAMDLFGARAGPQLLPLLKMGEGGIDDLMKKAKELGIVVSTEAATAAAEFTDRLTDLKGSLAGAGRMIGDTLIPAITPLIEKTIEIVGRVKEWVDENKPLVENIVKWGAALGVALLVLGPIAVILPSLIAGVTMLSGAFLPFAVTAGIVLGIKKLSEYLGDVKIKAFEAYTGFKEWDLDRLNKGIAEVTKIIADLETELEEIDKPIKILGIEFERQDVNIDRLKQTIKDYKTELGLLGGELKDRNKAKKEEIELDEEAAKIAAKLTAERTKQQAAIDALAAEKELDNAQTEIGNRLYELTLTPMENQRRLLDELKESYEKKGIAQEIVDEWYGKEITELDKLNEKLEDNKDIMGEVARVTKAVEDAIFELTHEPYEVVLKGITEKYDDLIERVKESTLTTKEKEDAIAELTINMEKEIELVDKTTEAEKEAKRQKDILIDTYKELDDRIYELTHTSMEYNIKKLDEQKQKLIDLGIEGAKIDEWYEEEIKLLGRVGDAYTLFAKVASDAVTKIVGYLETNLSNAIYDLWSDVEDFGWDWDKFWEGLWDTLKRWVSNMIAKLLILLPILAIVAWVTGGLSWAKILEVLAYVGISFNKGGGAGYDLGGQVKEYQFGGVTDTVPARLTVGEYVIAKPMTDFIKRFKAIPQNLVDAVVRGLPTPVPAFAGGGAVGNPNITSTGYGDTNINVYISGNKISDEVDIKKLAVTVSDEILRKINLNRRH